MQTACAEVGLALGGIEPPAQRPRKEACAAVGLRTCNTLRLLCTGARQSQSRQKRDGESQRRVAPCNHASMYYEHQVWCVGCARRAAWVSRGRVKVGDERTARAQEGETPCPEGAHSEVVEAHRGARRLQGLLRATHERVLPPCRQALRRGERALEGDSGSVCWHILTEGT